MVPGMEQTVMEMGLGVRFPTHPGWLQGPIPRAGEAQGAPGRRELCDGEDGYQGELGRSSNEGK